MDSAVYLDPMKIAHDLCKPLRDTLASIKSEEQIYRRRRQGIETTASRNHLVRSKASKKAWITIRANRERLAKEGGCRERKNIPSGKTILRRRA